MDTPNTESTIDYRVTTTTLKPGDILHKKYRVESVLGKGGMGTVYKVEQINLRVALALKTLDERRVVDSILVKRFENEAQASFALHHPNLVRLHDYGFLESGQPYLVMDLVEGCTLESYIKQKGRLRIEETRLIFEQICAGLSYAHERGVVHRDIKPGNIMLSNEINAQGARVVKILDFGIAKIMTPDGSQVDALTRTGEIFGSPLYMSPEQCMGDSIDQRSDIYSLGCVLFETLSGSPPLIGQNALRTMMMHKSTNIPTLKEASLGHDFPDKCEYIVAKMLEKNPTDRYRDLDGVAADLRSMTTNNSTRELNSKRKVATSKKLELPTVGFAAIIIVTIVVSATVSHLLTSINMSQKQALTKPLEPQPVANSTVQPGQNETANINHAPTGAEKAHADFAKAGPINSTYFNIGGKKIRRIHFPHTPIGMVWTQTDDSHEEDKSAVSDFDCAANTDAGLRVNTLGRVELLKNADVYKKIGPNEFQIFVYEGSGQDPIVGNIADGNVLDEPALGTIIRAAENWQSLKELQFKRSKIDNSTIDTFCRFKHIRKFFLEDCELDVARLASHKNFMHGIEHFNVSLDRAAPLIDGLSGSKNIWFVGFHASDITGADLSKLRTCPKLIELRINNKTISDEMLAAALSIPSLQRIWIPAPLTQKQLDTLWSDKKLQQIFVRAQYEPMLPRHDKRFCYI